MSHFPTYLTLSLLASACTFNTENNLSSDDGGPAIRVDAGVLDDDASQTDAANDDAMTPDGALASDAAITPPLVCDPTDTDLLLCMTFDSLTTPTTITDESGNDNTANFSNGAIIEARDGLGLQTQPSYTSSISPTPALNGAKTIEMWVRPDTVANAFQGLFEGKDYYFYIYGGGLLGCESKSINNDLARSTIAVITAGQWQHVACVMNASGAKLFVNGVEIQDADRGVGSEAYANPNSYTIARGSMMWSNVRLFGMIDTLRVWSTDRSGQICPQCDSVVPLASASESHSPFNRR